MSEDIISRKEVRRRILYLDTALPHRGTYTMIDTLRYGEADTYEIFSLSKTGCHEQTGSS